MIIYENGEQVEYDVVVIYNPFPDPKPTIEEEKENDDE